MPTAGKVWASLLIAGVVALVPTFARKKPDPANSSITVEMSQQDRVLHAWNRLAFGPRPGDVERTKDIGLDRWIEQQLHPERIPENPVLATKLQPLDTLRMSSAELAKKYPPPNVIKAVAEGTSPLPKDPETRAYVERLAARYRDKKGVADDGVGAVSLEQAEAPLSADQKQILGSGDSAQQGSILLTLTPDQRLDLLKAMPPGQRMRLLTSATPELRRDIQKSAGGMIMNQDLVAGKILRAVYSDRQLEEVLTDFWFNHFNIFLDKGADRYLVNSYEQEVIRPHIFGKFRDLLLATAKSPAMLFYLDNFQSVKADFQPFLPNAQHARRGLNENYARELMELHTLGVDGGYTQRDVTEVARCFTGWTILQPQRGGGFYFNPRQHDQGEKHVLGVTIPAGGGIDDGYKVIDILARNPATARFISRSLAIRFVSDNPPESLVNRMAETFAKKDGDLHAVMETMIKSSEFWSQDAYRSKLKSPFEMVVSALRATQADVGFALPIAGRLNQLGEPLYRKREPTGYSNVGAEWMNSAALLGRMNFALALASNTLPGVRVATPTNGGVSEIARSLMGVDLSPESRAVVEKDASQGSPSMVAGLTLGSPDFQRR